MKNLRAEIKQHYTDLTLVFICTSNNKWLNRNPCMKDDKQRDKIRLTLHTSNPDLNVWL